ELCARVARRELHDQAVEFYSQAVQTEGFYDVHVFETSPGCIAIDFVDITERKLSEQIAQARIRLFEFSATHSLEELLRATLDEAEALTGSQIGFYHFLEADQTTLWLQNWSTRTVESYCKAEGKGSHYPVRQAGVWVDCIQARGPVIHNDYASLPHRKGLPAGHAELIRELVVPVMRGDSIVAILGVGNKPWDYSKRDVEMVNKLADLAWDITGRKRAELALQKSEALLNESQSLSLAGGWEYDNLTQKITWTREVYRIYGVSEYFDPNDITRTIGFYAPEDQRLIEDAFARACQEGQPYDLELRFVNTQGTALWVRTQGNPLVENGKVVRVTGNIMDITASKQAEEHLRQLNSKMARQLAENEALRAMLLEQSTHDALTGLFNRRYMDDSLERELARAQREAYPVSILMIDIDYFKRFNDNHGHSAGDQVLIGLGHLLHASVRESDIPCRYGGEEFIIILPQANLRDALVRAEQIRQDFSNLRIEALPNEISPTLSVGVAAFPEHGASIDRLIQAADRALYAAKAAGRNCISLAEVG
ncbi:MAG: diguanylate cyclase, partial [Chloroflexi bacterium]|nr:diguanylate cyclase [Chloroflexota bacterium]